jgi:hypothetical protein
MTTKLKKDDRLADLGNREPATKLAIRPNILPDRLRQGKLPL